jgi:predicted unusual protein kinase regulating ubiquinone biosynthesis (AarF/ABC1/UbiB family)
MQTQSAQSVIHSDLDGFSTDHSTSNGVHTSPNTNIVDSSTTSSTVNRSANSNVPSTANPTAVPAVPVEQAVNANRRLKSAELGDQKGLVMEYDPEAIAHLYRGKFFKVWGRALSIFWTFFSFILSLWWDRQTGQAEQKQPQRAVQLREILTHLGPAYIKIGQALSTRPDLVPPTYLEELTLLQDQLPPFPNEIAFQFIQEELGDRPENLYAELSAQPVAAASLGQVYKGKLKTGETVAVKVQRPGLAERITLDIYILRQLAVWATQTIKRLRSDLVGIMDEFGARIFEEMDYSHEGRNAERFAQLYGHLKDIYVPKIYWEYTGRRVLTMEWITGTKLTQPAIIREQGIDASYLIEIGVQCSLRQLLEHGFFHADPHPGNLLATPDGKLAYLDFGMMSEIKSYQRYGLIEAVVHMVNRDFEGLANDYVKLEFLSPDTDLTPIVPALAGVFGNALGASVAELNFKSITDQLSALMYEYPFRVPAYYALIIRSLVTLEGIAINVDPNFKVLSKAYPYIAKRLLIDPSPELRNSLRDLLFKDDSFRWNRLENLLRNAQNSPDYDLNQVLEQAIDFLFSERGEFIRVQIADEIVRGLDTYGQTTLQRVRTTLLDRFGLNGHKPTPQPAAATQPNGLENLLRILAILQDTPGFDPLSLLPLVPRLLSKPETQQMGQHIASGLAQRAIARLVREFLLSDSSNGQLPQPVQNGAKVPTAKASRPLALPAGNGDRSH